MISKNSPKYEAIIYDMDGVFVDTEPLHYRSFVDVFEPMGIEISLDSFYTFIGFPTRKNISDINRDFGLNININEYNKRLESRYLEILSKEILRPLPGVLETMRLARDIQMKIGLATSSSRKQFNFIMRNMLKQADLNHELDGIFDAVVTGKDVKDKKPAPEPYIYTAQKLGVETADCIVIEDSESGILSAKAAGCFCIARRAPYNDHMDLSKADKIVSSIEEVAEEKFFI